MFSDDFRNGPLSPETSTGAVLFRFIHTLIELNYGVINIHSYKVIQIQKW